MSVKLDYEQWCVDNNINFVIDLLCNKGLEILEKFPKDSLIYLDEWDSTTVEIFSENVDQEVTALLEEETRFFSNIKNIQRVIYMFTKAGGIIEEHVDEDDTETYRIIVGVNSSDNYWFENIGQQDKKFLKKGNSIGIDVEVEPHKGKNEGSTMCSSIIICLYKEYV